MFRTYPLNTEKLSWAPLGLSEMHSIAITIIHDRSRLKLFQVVICILWKLEPLRKCNKSNYNLDIKYLIKL